MPDTETVRLDGGERYETVGPGGVTVTVVNLGPASCYYGASAAVTAIANDGTLSIGSSLSFEPTKFFVSAGRSRLYVTTPTRLEQIEADSAVGPAGPTGATGGVGPAGGTALTLVDKTSNFTLALADVGKHYQASAAGAIVVTVPTNAAAEIPVGSVFTVIRRGVGSVAFSPSVGVTVNSPYSYLSLGRQFSSAAAIKVATDEWDLFGDLA